MAILEDHPLAQLALRPTDIYLQCLAKDVQPAMVRFLERNDSQSFLERSQTDVASHSFNRQHFVDGIHKQQFYVSPNLLLTITRIAIWYHCMLQAVLG